MIMVNHSTRWSWRSDGNSPECGMRPALEVILCANNQYDLGSLKNVSSLSFLINDVAVKYLFYLAHRLLKDANKIKQDFCEVLYGRAIVGFMSYEPLYASDPGLVMTTGQNYSFLSESLEILGATESCPGSA